MQVSAETVSFPLAAPFAITGYTFHDTDTLRVTVAENGVSGRGESVGTYYLGETAESMLADVRAVEHDLAALKDRAELQELMPACGARNALDCSLWDLQCKLRGESIWDRLALTPRPLTTVFTLGIAEPEAMAAAAAEARGLPQLKLKLDGDWPVERVEAVRRARPDARLIVDVNQGWSFDELQEYLPSFARLGIAMIEQPLPRGEDECLEGFRSPVPLGADESCLHLGEFENTRRRYDVLNIKLDKCGGLTEGLALVQAARGVGMELMVGNMMGSSLSMAPSFVIGQSCSFVDLDGPLLLAHDIDEGMVFTSDGEVQPPAGDLWG